MNKNQQGTSSMKKISFSERKYNVKVSKEKNQNASLCNKFHEQNQFHKEKDRCTILRKINMQQVSGIKIITQQVSRK